MDEIINKEEITELQKAFNVIAEASMKVLVNNESMDDLIKFITENEMTTELNGKKYTLIYKKPKDSKGKISFSKNLNNFYIKKENGNIKPVYLKITDIRMLSNEINKEKTEKKLNEYIEKDEEVIKTKNLTSNFLAAMIDYKNKWTDFNHDLEKIEKYFINEIKKLQEEKEQVENNPNKLNTLKKLINQKEISLKIATGEKAKEIIQIASAELKPEIIEELRELYMNSIEIKEEEICVKNINSIENELTLIAKNIANFQINKKSIDQLIKFAKETEEEIVIKINDENYKLKYDESLISKKDAISNYKIKLRGFVFEGEKGEIKPAYLIFTDAIILNYAIQESIEEKKNKQSGREVHPTKRAEVVLSSIIEAKEKLKQNNYDKVKTTAELEKEIEDLNESKKPLGKKQSILSKKEKAIEKTLKQNNNNKVKTTAELEKEIKNLLLSKKAYDEKENKIFKSIQPDKENDKKQKIIEEKTNIVKKLNLIQKLIKRKKLSIQIVSDQLISEIRQIEVKKTVPEILEKLINLYENTINQSKNKTEKDDADKIIEEK